MEIASGEVRINGRQVFINNAEVSGLKPMPPKHYVRRPAPTNQNAPAHVRTAPVPVRTAPIPVGKGAQGRLDRARYWSDQNPSRRKQYKALYHGRMALNSRKQPVHEYTDCGRFVNQIVHADDPNYPIVSTGPQKKYIEQNWTNGAIGEGDGPQPGDVLIVHNNHHGHTAIYKGPGANGTYEVYNASLGGHGPKISYFAPSFFEIWGRPKQ